MSVDRRSEKWIAKTAALRQKASCVKEVTERHEEKLVACDSGLDANDARLREGNDIVTGLPTDSVSIN